MAESEPEKANESMSPALEVATKVLVDGVPAQGLQVEDLRVGNIVDEDLYCVWRGDSVVDVFQAGSFSTATGVLNFLSRHTTETFDLDDASEHDDYDEWGVQ